MSSTDNTANLKTPSGAHMNTSPSKMTLAAVLGRHGLLGLLVLLFITFSVFESSTFPSASNISTMLLMLSVPGMLAISVLLPAIVGEFDLSPGYLLGFTAVVAASLGGKLGWNTAECIAGALVAGALVGLINGVLVAYFRIRSLIATLGIGIALSGLSVGVSGSRTLSVGIPEGITSLATTNLFGVGSAVYITVIVYVIAYILLEHTPFGRKTYAVGGSERVAILSGLPTTRIKLIAFVVAGVLAALAGMFQLGLTGAANPNYGSTLLLPAFAAVFLGSTSVQPGVFNVRGTGLAVLVLGVGFTGLSLMGVPFWFEPVFNGAMLLGGVVLSSREARKAQGQT
ncbi:ABC transporter permease [Ochrobactrum sp. Q0168]|uniref:ABC transporter permease n=1 Tax=Ochrobactrum sp. Q0168 TaxID=2793241 RepID=UPI0018EA5416|nr:ABC transporter permease [Ochrobactrum sp. Q0168]